MKVLVCGSRTWTDAARVRERLQALPPDTTIIHGGAGGADRLAAREAQSIGLRVRAFPADWDGLGKRAGFIRNLAMFDQRPDLVLAFWDGRSRGTAHVVGEAHRRRIPVEIIAP